MDGERPEQAAEDAKSGADLEGRAPPEAAYKRADRERAEPHSKDEKRNGCSGQAFVRRQHGADNAAGGNDDGVVAAGKRLRHRKHKGVAAGQQVVAAVEVGAVESVNAIVHPQPGPGGGRVGNHSGDEHGARLGVVLPP